MKIVQYNVDQIGKYMTFNGFTLSAEKTVFVIFTNNRHGDDYYIEVDGCKISPSKTVKYLGVIFDTSLTWKSHIDYLLSKTNSVWNLIKIIKHNRCGLDDPKVLVQVIRALVRARLSYGQEAYFSAAPSLLHRLESRETSFIKSALGMAKHAHPTLVYREVGLLPLSAERELRTAQYVARVASVADHSTARELQPDFNSASDEAFINRQTRTPNVARRGLGVPDYVDTLFREAAVTTSNLDKELPPSLPPWTLARANITVTLSTESKTENPLLLTCLAKENINRNYSDHLKIFTDGSKLDNGKVGCAYVIPEKGIARTFRTNNDVSIFTAEILAIDKALTYLESQVNLNQKSVIFSDSKSSLQALLHPGNSRANIVHSCCEKLSNLLQSGCEVDLCWVPSHCNIYGNDLADRAAKQAANLPTVTVDLGLSLSEMYSKLKIASKDKWKSQFTRLAQEKEWLDPYVVGEGVFPKLKQNLLPIFYRMRTKTIKTDHIPVNCICGCRLKFDHVFQCGNLRMHLPKTLSLLQLKGLPLSHSFFSTTDIDLRLIEVFIKELIASPVGYFI